MATILDRAPEVIAMLGNRTDITSRVYQWISDAYVELAMGYKFEELEDTRMPLTSAWVDTYPYDTDVRAVKTLSITFNLGTPAQTQRRLWRRNIRNIDRYSNQPGSPAVYAPYNRSAILRPVPDQSYQMTWRVWLKPAIDPTIQNTILNVPDDWLEIIDYAAAMRGWTKLMEFDKSQAIFAMLFGGGEDQKTKKPYPGLIKGKMLLRQAESEDDNYPISPRVRRYSHGV